MCGHLYFTVLETAKANRLNPEAYLNHLLTVLPERFVNDPNEKVNDLFPRTVGMRAVFGRLNAEC